MKKIIFLIGLIFQVTTFAAPVSQTTTATTIATKMTPAAMLTQQSNSSNQNIAAPANNILTKQKAMYTLRLNSNPTTGFSWFLVGYPSKLLTLVKHQYFPAKAKIPGAGGYEIWQFKATSAAFIAPRLIKVKLIYAQPWDVKDTSTMQTFIVVTK